MTGSDRSAVSGPSANRRPSAWLLFPIAIAALAGLIRWSAATTEPTAEVGAGAELVTVDVASSGATYASIDELTAASDLVVIGTIAGAESGRTISDPTNPDVGIRTTLYQLEVERLLVGSAGGEIIIEHETSLADGTPIAINGASAPATGNRVLLFLIAGPSDVFPHHAIINEQGRYEVTGRRLVAATAHALADEVVGLGLDDLIDSLTSPDP